MTLLHPQPSPSAEAIAGNEDLMTEILICLPTKSLCRFKCVSKQWNSLISHPHFSHRRLPKSISDFHLPIYWHADLPSYIYVHLAGKRTRGDPFTSLTFVDEPMGIKILHSSNGFLLCSSSNHSHNPNPNYFIYNPTTKQFAIIPPPNDDATCDASAMNLASDPNKAPHYKIVSVRSRRVRTIRSWNNQIEIYSSENGSWRLSGDPFTCKINTSRVFKNGVFCNGTIHWLNSSVMESWLRFDVEKECLGTMPMLPIQDGGDRMVIDYFGVSQGHLHLVCCKSYSAPFEVFELESDYSKWFVKYHVHLNAITATFPECPSIRIGKILHLVREEVEEESYLVLYMPGLVVSYNFKDKTLKKLRNLFRDSRYFEAHHHIETLVHI